MTIRKAFRYRLYPNSSQQQALSVQFGHARFVFNWGLSTRKAFYKEHGKGLGFFPLKRMLPVLKAEHPGLKDADSQALQAKIEDLDRAFRNFFEGRAKYPKLKKRKDGQSIRYPQRFRFDKDRIYLPKVGWVKVVLHRPLEGVPKNVTVSKTKSGKFFVSIQCEVRINPPVNTKPAVGVDLGLKDFAVLSTGEHIGHPKNLIKSGRRLARLQRCLSRKRKGSRNREKARYAVARLHEKIASQRADFLHKLSHRLAEEHGLIKMESLNITGMLKNHRLARSISDSGWNMFVRFCTYKAEWNGGQAGRVGRFLPSSKTCSSCGLVMADMGLSVRKWTCPQCGTLHDRDENAAKVILNSPTAGAAGSQARGARVSRYGRHAVRLGRGTGKPDAFSIG